jgi:PPIC-type peptidyl-prolyl cis-trans isomerase-like protein
MQRWLTILLGTLAVGLALLVAYRSVGDRPAGAPKHAATLDAGAAIALRLDAGTDAADLGDGPRPLDFLADLGSSGSTDPRVPEQGPGWRLPDGKVPPQLPEGTPKQVHLGVVILTFAGAQGAPPGARSKRDALEAAQKLAADARGDFHGSVIRGDSGSADDIGHVPRGVLEMGTEYVAFTMPAGSVSDPLETPRGYWIIKRLD